ncbi:hypothetical protein, partial [Citrobacter freundii]|uniref:hypothetical protein n=1 Tax=Citrobacter freundii TaxID=546 RepID=UPI001C433820
WGREKLSVLGTSKSRIPGHCINWSKIPDFLLKIKKMLIFKKDFEHILCGKDQNLKKCEICSKVKGKDIFRSFSGAHPCWEGPEPRPPSAFPY